MPGRQFKLAVIGSGSGNVVIPDDFGDGEVALIEAGAFGRSYSNRGCIPTKMFAYTADFAMQIRQASQFALTATLDAVGHQAWVLIPP